MMELRRGGGERAEEEDLRIGGDERLRLSPRADSTSEGQFFQRRKWRARD
jgi:hypothetical protein